MHKRASNLLLPTAPHGSFDATTAVAGRIIGYPQFQILAYDIMIFVEEK
jgi:hypothetical protein